MVQLEVETKVKIENVPRLRKRIRAIARLKKNESRGDDYFALEQRGYPRKAFRIRHSGGKYVVNFKKRLKHLFSKDIVVKEEYEFELGGGKNLKYFLALIEDLGFKEWVKKRKHTEGYVHKKDKRIIIEINKVEHLGYYMEIEYLATRSEVGKAKKKIRKTLEELGIKEDQIDNVGYTRRLYDKGIKDKKYFIGK
jgi:predicted adenylyl cyclase CyaB